MSSSNLFNNNLFQKSDITSQHLNFLSPFYLDTLILPISAMHNHRYGTTFTLSPRYSVTQDCLYTINETENRSDTQLPLPLSGPFLFLGQPNATHATHCISHNHVTHQSHCNITRFTHIRAYPHPQTPLFP